MGNDGNELPDSRRELIEDKGNHNMPFIHVGQCGCKKAGPHKEYTAEFYRGDYGGFEYVTGEYIDANHQKKADGCKCCRPVEGPVKKPVNLSDHLYTF